MRCRWARGRRTTDLVLNFLGANLIIRSRCLASRLEKRWDPFSLCFKRIIAILLQKHCTCPFIVSATLNNSKFCLFMLDKDTREIQSFRWALLSTRLALLIRNGPKQHCWSCFRSLKLPIDSERAEPLTHTKRFLPFSMNRYRG